MTNHEAADLLRTAIYRKESNIFLGHCNIDSMDSIMELVIDSDPRIALFVALEDFQYNFRTNVWRKSVDYNIRIGYNPSISSIDQVIVYDGQLSLMQLLKSRKENEIFVIGKEAEKLLDEVDDVHDALIGSLEGYNQLYWYSANYKEYVLLRIYVQFSMEGQKLQKAIQEADSEIKRICSVLKCHSDIPDFLKIYLFYSYVSQNCTLDLKAEAEELEIGKNTLYENAKISYGVVCDHRAASLGIAWTMKHFFDSLGLENYIVSGMMKDNGFESHNYYWNMIRFEGKFYHIDASWNINNEGIFIDGFMADDETLIPTHAWLKSYPKCTGTKYRFYYIMDYLVDNREELLEMGIPEYVLYPDLYECS